MLRNGRKDERNGRPSPKTNIPLDIFRIPVCNNLYDEYIIKREVEIFFINQLILPTLSTYAHKFQLRLI